MSKRTDIKANLITRLEAISKVREVSTKYKTLEQVNKSRMPYIQILSVVEKRERADSSRNTKCKWTLSIWCYVRNEDDIETWVANIKDMINDDRTCGTYARDCYVEEIVTDNVLLGSTVRGLIVAMVVVEFREKD